MSVQPPNDAFDDFLREALLTLASEESEHLLNDFGARGVSPVVAEMATSALAIAIASKTIVFNAKGDQVALQKARDHWIDTFTKAFDAALAEIPALMAATPEVTPRQILDAAAAGDKCPGCGEVHDEDIELLAELDARLTAAQKRLN